MDRVSVKVDTFGCKVNSYDTGLLQQWLSQGGFALTEMPQVHVLNSCAVTAEASRQVLRQARRLKRENPEGIVVVTGCSAQVDTEMFSQSEFVDLVVGNSHKGDLPKLLKEHLQGESEAKVFKSNIFRKSDLESGGGEEAQHTRSFLKIQDGCDSFCTFCVIPFARGKSRSIEPEVLAQRINELHEQGIKEIVLTGVHIGDYRTEKGQGLSDLVEHLLRNTAVPRLRLSSLEPIELEPNLVALFADDRLCRHFHMSIQSASSTVLEKMKRRYGQREVVEALRLLAQRVPGAYVGMDVIAGFPEESDAEFEETFAALADTPWTRIHVFPYSARPGTYAARSLDNLRPELIKERARRLRDLSRERHQAEALSQIGQRKRVLGLRGQVGLGVARDYWSVACEGLIPGEERWVRVRGADREENSQGNLTLYGDIDTPQNST